MASLGTKKREPRHRPGFVFIAAFLQGSAGPDAAAVRVRPLVLVAVAAREERRGRPGALVVGLGAGPAVPPAGPHRVGDGLAGLVADQGGPVSRVPPAPPRAAAAA